MHSKKIMVLGAGLLQLSVIKKAKELGYYCLVLDANPNAIGFKYANKSIVVDITDPKNVLKIGVIEKIDGVIHPCSEVAMNSMGLINDTLGLSGIGLEAVSNATNKGLMRRAFEKGGAPTPLSISVNNKDEIQEAFNKINDNAIIKPSRSSGSRGVSFLSKKASPNDILIAFERAFKESRDFSVVIEQFVTGPEFSVEMLIWNNIPRILTVTDKKTTNEPYFIELGHSQPSVFSVEDVNKIESAAIQGVKALGLNQCVAHAEVKLSQEGPYLMEIGARLGGDFISTELVHLSTGIDMTSCAINIALGLEPDLNIKSMPMGAAIRYFVAKPGIVDHVLGLDEVLSNDYIYDLKIYVDKGDIIRPLVSSMERCGHVITTGRDAASAIINAENVIDAIKIITI